MTNHDKLLAQALALPLTMSAMSRAYLDIMQLNGGSRKPPLYHSNVMRCAKCGHGHKTLRKIGGTYICTDCAKEEIRLPDELYTHETLPDGRIITYCTMRQQILHCIGMVDSGSNRHGPYRRHGKLFYRPWRNYFSTPRPEKNWEELCAYGYATHGPVNNNGVCYWMTRQGLDWLGEQLGMTIYDEED